MEKDLYEEQLRLESRMARLGVDKFRDSYERWTRAKRATDTKSVRTAMDAAIAPLVGALEAFFEQAKTGKAGRRHSAIRLLAGLEIPVVAFMTVKIVMDGLIRAQELTPLAVRLAEYLNVENNVSNFKGQEGDLGKTIGKYTKEFQSKNSSPHYAKNVLEDAVRRHMDDPGLAWQSWSLSEKTTVGLKLIELLCQSTGLFEVRPQRKFKKMIYILVPTERFDKWLDSLNGQQEILMPEYLPCIIPPKDWDGLQSGGYHGEAFAYPINFVKTRSSAHRKALSEADLSPIFKMVNALQRTPWAINTQVLDVAFYLMDLGTGLAGLPNRVLELPAKPHDIATNKEAKVAWSREAGRIWRGNIESKMQRLQAWKTIKIAQEFRKYDKIYFPYSLDFRGRIYTIPSHLTPQGTDLAKGLLQFGEGDPILDQQSRDWLSIHGANCFGLDKVAFCERIQWVKGNEQRIIETACEPLDDLWWTEADSPFCFLAFCFEWKEFLRCEAKGETFISHLAIAMDGSCNGLQHYSAMLRDPVAGKAVNLIPSDKPQDIYGAVAERVMTKLREAASQCDEDNPEYQAWAQVWLDFGIDRKITKRPVMVLPYGGTFHSCMDYVLAAVHERGTLPYEQQEIHPACNYLAKLVWQSIGEVVVSAKLAMKWLRGVAQAAMRRGEAVSWVTPIGFPVVQHYMQMNSIRIETTLFGKKFQPRLEIPNGDKPARNQQVNGFAPNFVHSLDACALMMTVNRSVDQGITKFAMIHDSFGTTAAKAEQLAKILRQEFINLYEEDSPLKQFETKEEPPFVGGLDLSQVLTSKYFFA